MARPAFRRIAAVAVALVATLAVAAQPTAASAQDEGRELLLRSSLVGSTPAPAGPALFGVAPGNAPWVIGNGRVRVEADGDLHVGVRRLVIPTPPANGTNPVPTLSASVVCNGAIVATTPAVPFNAKGNARIDTSVTLPSPCLAPAVLLHPGTNTSVYIAANGA